MVTRASFLTRSAAAPFTPASLSKACFTSLSQPPQVMPVTVNSSSLVSFMFSSFMGWTQPQLDFSAAGPGEGSRFVPVQPVCLRFEMLSLKLPGNRLCADLGYQGTSPSPGRTARKEHTPSSYGAGGRKPMMTLWKFNLYQLHLEG